MNNDKKSLSKNALLNGLRNILNLIFPLITFPYVSRILLTEELGKYNFASTFINYFLSLAALGISTYAVREGSKYRNDKKLFNDFANQVFTINFLSTLFSYILLFICLMTTDRLDNYNKLIVIFSLQIIFTTLGVEWIYSIFEEYQYITIRSITFKILSIIFLFIFVKSESDTWKYACITVFASIGSNIFNLIHSRKFCRLNLVKNNLKIHLKPILIIFASNIAVLLYVNSDITMLGFMKNDYVVGIYSVSVKIYSIVKSLLSAILIVSIPRLSMLYGQKKFKEFNIIVQKVIDSLTVLLLPAVIGVCFLAKKIIIFISGAEYVEATSSLIILSIGLIFCIYGWIFNQCVLLPAQKEKIIFIATCISAIINILLNALLIPIWGENAAAFTTLIAELIIFVVCRFYGRTITSARIMTKNIFSVFIGSIAIAIICFVSLQFDHIPLVINLFGTIIFSAIVYAIILLITKNETFIYFYVKFFSKIKRR